MVLNSNRSTPYPTPPAPALCTFAALVIGLMLTGSGCGRSGASPPPPPPAVTVARPVQQEVTDWDEYPGRLAAIDMVDVRPRVSGFVEQASFDEGSIVHQGDVLFTIDPRPYQAELDRANATLAQAEAQQRYQAGEWERLQPLRQTGAVAETQYLATRQAFETANAAVQATKAAIESAKLNVEWCRVSAPITGRIGRKIVTPGNLVTGGGTSGTATGTLLTTITSLDPIYCYADVDERSILRYQHLVREYGRPSARSGQLPAQLAVGAQPDFNHYGHIDFVDNRIDPNTGTISIRGVFANPGHQLLPGLYARLRILGRGPHQALLIPDAAIGATLAQQFILVVDKDDIIQYRRITPGPRFGALREVDGIAPNDRIVVEGLVNLRPGTRVRPRLVPVTATTQPAASQPSQPPGISPGPSRSTESPAAEDGSPGTPGPGGAPGSGRGGTSGPGGAPQ